MNTIKNNRPNSTTWPIVLVTVIITAAILISVLYSFDLLATNNSQLVDSLVHAEEMVHTEGMVHTADMDHGSANDDRQHEVAERGKMVMSFDLERSTHVFEKTDFGGIQQVISDDNDAEQIQLIQAHLEEEFGHFQNGDFADPAKIHGGDMPGLAELQTGHENFEVVYEIIPTGGQITYSTTNNEIKDAIHAWFDAQLSDHGSHATDN